MSLSTPRGSPRLPPNRPGLWRHCGGAGNPFPALARWSLVLRSWHHDTDMANATITVDAALKERLAALAGQAGQRVDEFVEALLRRIADADVRLGRAYEFWPDALSPAAMAEERTAHTGGSEQDQPVGSRLRNPSPSGQLGTNADHTEFGNAARGPTVV